MKQPYLSFLEYPVQAKEGDQAVLDCFLPWHRLLLGGPEYHYSWAQGSEKVSEHKPKRQLKHFFFQILAFPHTLFSVQLEENDFKVLVVTDDSSVVLNQLHVEERGTYRCSLQNQTGTVFYKVTFLVSGKHQIYFIITYSVMN